MHPTWCWIIRARLRTKMKEKTTKEMKSLLINANAEKRNEILVNFIDEKGLVRLSYDDINRFLNQEGVLIKRDVKKNNAAEAIKELSDSIQYCGYGVNDAKALLLGLTVSSDRSFKESIELLDYLNGWLNGLDNFEVVLWSLKLEEGLSYKFYIDSWTIFNV